MSFVTSSRRILLAVAAAFCGLAPATPGLADLPPPSIRFGDRLEFGAPILAPMAHTVFCLGNPEQCRTRRVVFRGGRVRLTAERLAALQSVNIQVNRAIQPERNDGGIATERWTIAPQRGDCNDYAVTKQSLLRGQGWPARALILSEVVTRWGEHHLVLTVRTRDGDFVLDSLREDIVTVGAARYSWVRAQSPDNPALWSRIRVRPPVRMASVFRLRGSLAR